MARCSVSPTYERSRNCVLCGLVSRDTAERQDEFAASSNRAANRRFTGLPVRQRFRFHSPVMALQSAAQEDLEMSGPKAGSSRPLDAKRLRLLLGQADLTEEAAAIVLEVDQAASLSRTRPIPPSQVRRRQEFPFPRTVNAEMICRRPLLPTLSMCRERGESDRMAAEATSAHPTTLDAQCRESIPHRDDRWP